MPQSLIRNVSADILNLMKHLTFLWIVIPTMISIFQVTIWWAGLMRGAVSMALAYNKVTTRTILSFPQLIYMPFSQGNAMMLLIKFTFRFGIESTLA